MPDAVGAFVEWLLNQSGWEVTERSGAEPVPVGARHVCLLFRRFQSFGDDLSRRTCARSRRGASRTCSSAAARYHDREEVLAMRNARRGRRVARRRALGVLATLRGPFFALPDDALLLFRDAGRRRRCTRCAGSTRRDWRRTEQRGGRGARCARRAAPAAATGGRSPTRSRGCSTPPAPTPASPSGRPASRRWRTCCACSTWRGASRPPGASSFRAFVERLDGATPSAATPARRRSSRRAPRACAS